MYEAAMEAARQEVIRMATPVDLSTRENALAHLKSIIVELETERQGQRPRPQDREFRDRRLEVAVLLLYAELIARTQPELAEEAERRVVEKSPRPEPRPDVPKPTRDFVGELQTMAGKEPRPGPPHEPRR